jgi:hypothetical protein
MRDLVRFLPLKSQFVLSGNVRDMQIALTADGSIAPVPLLTALHGELATQGLRRDADESEYSGRIHRERLQIADVARVSSSHEGQPYSSRIRSPPFLSFAKSMACPPGSPLASAPEVHKV